MTIKAMQNPCEYTGWGCMAGGLAVKSVDMVLLSCTLSVGGQTGQFDICKQKVQINSKIYLYFALLKHE